MTNKERIIMLAKTFPAEEVAQIAGVSLGYVYKVLRASSAKTLTPTNYVNAILSGLTSDAEIAEHFGVSRSTIIRFKKTHGLKFAAAFSLYSFGWSMERIKNTLYLTTEEAANLDALASLEEIKERLLKTQNALQPYNGKVDQITDQLTTIAQLLKVLNC